MSVPKAPDAPQPSFSAVSQEQWRTLATKRLYFGRQSVGRNIIDGVQAVLADHPEIPLQVFESTTFDSSSPPGLYHSGVGQNGDPGSKTSAFTGVVSASRPAVAMLKFCYLDVEDGKNPDSLFARYQADMSALQKRRPDLVVVHVTMPLTTASSWRGILMAKLRRRSSANDLNLIRNRYNALLRQAYVGKEPVFDLARVESTHTDGSRSYFVRGGDTVYTLAPELTDDGGHLNPEGRRAAAEAFLAVLATL